MSSYSRYSLEHLSDDSLLDELHSFTARDRKTTAGLLARIGETARRRLYAERGYPSMTSYCIRELRFSEDAARKRVQVARKGWLFPVIFEAIADGRVHLSGMNLLVPFIDEENVLELIEAASHKTYRQIQLYLAERYPQPEPEESVRDAAPHLRSRSMVKPIAPGRYVVQFTIDEDDYERLEYALQLMSHRNPRGSLAFLNRVALELLIAELENEKLGATDDPRDGEGTSSGRHIPRAVRRAVWKRDGGACTYVSPTGRRCGSRWMLEFDHIHEFARGGEATVDNVRVLCRAHNQLEAEHTYGEAFMESKRRAS